MAVTDASDALISLAPTKELDAKKTFGIDLDWKVPAFAEKSSYVPDTDPAYRFDPQTTRAILAGFKYNRRVMIQGYHGTGKSTHIEQVAARLNWPLIRINLDSHVSRIDLVGKDAIVLKDGKQITEFREGILPWALQRPIALVFDEYDAGRPDVMFVIQRILEASGQLTLLDQNRVMKPHLQCNQLRATSAAAAPGHQQQGTIAQATQTVGTGVEHGLKGFGHGRRLLARDDAAFGLGTARLGHQRLHSMIVSGRVPMLQAVPLGQHRQAMSDRGGRQRSEGLLGPQSHELCIDIRRKFVPEPVALSTFQMIDDELGHHSDGNGLGVEDAAVAQRVPRRPIAHGGGVAACRVRRRAFGKEIFGRTLSRGIERVRVQQRGTSRGGDQRAGNRRIIRYVRHA
jgi:hypothetical protein